jgi:hypothetical protein
MSHLPFEDRARFPNPFGKIVGDPLEDNVDVVDINREAFEACQRLIGDVRTHHASGALTLFGEAGAGKTHILGRVRRWLQTEPASLFVPVRMDTSARMLWRHLRRNLADALLRTDASGQRALDRLLGPKSAAIGEFPERDLSIVLGNLLEGRHVRDSSAWLRGQDLPETALTRMDLAQPGPEDDQEAISRNLIASLCSMIEPGVAVFCLDQWEALQSFAGDTDGLFTTGQAVSFLHDPPFRNVCIISCVQTGFVPRLENVLDEAIRQRLLSRRQAIDLIDWDKALRLIPARLDEFPALSQVRRGQPDPLWPLSEGPIRSIFTANAAPARRVISRCKDLFDLWRIGEAQADESLDHVLQARLDERMRPVEPADAEAAMRTGLPLVLTSLARKDGTFDFALRGGSQLVALCNQTNGTSLYARLRKLDEALKPESGANLLLLRDSRLPIGEKAGKTRQRLKSIEDKRGRLVSVSQEAVESLGALRRLLADARSGDLAYHGDPVPVTKVEQWIAGHLPSAIEALLSEIDIPDLLSARLTDLIAQRKIVSIEEAARETASSALEVESCARRDPGLFGILQGGTSVLFQIVETEPVPAE